MKLAIDEIPGFIRWFDDKGGPEAIDRIPELRDFELTLEPDEADRGDPFSEAYLARQIALYGRLSGRSVDQHSNERTAFDLQGHVAAANPYGRRDTSHMARHTATLSNAFIQADLPNAPSVLDMGCGWGLSSELLAYLGADVTAVDINQNFIDLVSTRAAKSELPIKTMRSAFEDVATEDRFDMVLFYECLHHAIKPWSVLSKMAGLLKPGGVIALAGEPIQEIWWNSWGLRLDPLSLYCIGKFGWFESGWSRAFLAQMFGRIDMSVAFNGGSALSGEPICIARRRTGQESIAVSCLPPGWQGEGWIHEGDYWIAGARTRLVPPTDAGGSAAILEIWNFRGRDIDLAITGAHVDLKTTIMPGKNHIRIAPLEPITVIAETWRPSEESGTADDRLIGFHLRALEIEP